MLPGGPQQRMMLQAARAWVAHAAQAAILPICPHDQAAAPGQLLCLSWHGCRGLCVVSSLACIALLLACRSQLLQAAALLPRHITSLSERLGYMRQLLGLASLGAPERLELVARLLLNVRDELAPEVVKLCVPPSRVIDAAIAGSWHLWEATLYSWQEQQGGSGAGRGGDWRQPLPGEARGQAGSSNSRLWAEWGGVMSCFVMTAAQVGAAWGRWQWNGSASVRVGTAA